MKKPSVVAWVNFCLFLCKLLLVVSVGSLLILFMLFWDGCTEPTEPQYEELAPSKYEALTDTFGLDPTTAMEWVLGFAGPDPAIPQPLQTDSCDLNDITVPQFQESWIANTWPGNSPNGKVEIYADGFVLNWVDEHEMQSTLPEAIFNAASQVMIFDTMHVIMHDSGGVYIQDSVFRTDIAVFFTGTTQDIDLKIRIPGKQYTALNFDNKLMINAVGRGQCNDVIDLAKVLPSFTRYNVKWVGCSEGGWQDFHDACLGNCKCCARADTVGVPVLPMTVDQYVYQNWSF